MEFEAAAPEGLAGVSLTGLVGASSILEGLNQAVDAVVPLLSRFGSVEGAVRKFKIMVKNWLFLGNSWLILAYL